MLQILLYFLFFASAALLVLIILVQEGKGGGLGDAFGGGAAQSFGVRAGGVNKVTFGLFGALVLSAMLLHWTAPSANSGSVFEQEMERPSMGGPEDPGAGPAPAGQ